MYDIEIQKADKGASPKRARYNGSMMDIDFLKKGNDFDKLPVRYVIFISENGYKCNDKPLREFCMCSLDDGEILGDESHIIYVKGKNEDNSELGKLMRDLNNPNPDTMNYKMLSEVVGSFKKYKKGKEIIMTVSEKIYNAGLNNGKIEGKIEGIKEGEFKTLISLIKKGFLTLQQAAEQMGMSIENFEKEAKNLALL